MTSLLVQYEVLLDEISEINAAAERLRLRLAKKCKHPEDHQTFLTFGCLGRIGALCTICKMVKYDGGAWGPALAMELIAKKACKHPPAFQQDYTWEYDNGYGRQSQVVGDRCTFCGSRRSWKNTSNWMSEEQYRRDDD